mgnify:CR=1 FL=1
MFKKKKVEKQEELPKAMLKMQQEKQEREEGNEKPVEMENIKRPKSKHNKTNNKKITVKRIIIILIVIICIIVAIMLGISCYKWKTMAKDMFANKNSIVVDTDGKQIAELGSERKKIKVDSDKMPEKLKDAYVSIEDERFYKHHGVDIKRTTSAIFSYVFHAGNSSYGGSTITQQLVKNITGDNTDSVTRKIKEWWKAYQLEWYFSKDDILDMYLNVIYVGPNIYGVGAGSEYYFNKDVQKLSIAESAFLAGINNSPNSYNPFDKETDNTEKINKRTKTVLSKMKELKYISEDEYNGAISEVENGLHFNKGNVNSGDGVYSYHTDTLITEVIKDIANEKKINETFASNYTYLSGLTIKSTQNSTIQKEVENEFNKKQYSIKSKQSGETAQAAMVIIDHTTGRVVATVGGLGEKNTARGLNRATQSTRQTGSSIKPLAVLIPGIDKKIFTASTIYSDVEKTFTGNYSPKNYDGYLGETTVRRAVESSQNIPFVEMMQQITPKVAIQYLENMGITTLTKNDESLTLSLGGLEKGITPLEMAAAYATIANNGTYIEPTFYTEVINKSGKVVAKAKPKTKKVISEQVAYIVKEILTQPVKGNNGTAKYCSISGMDVAAKTGTTDDNYDRWLCGFTPYYTAATWFGYDKNETIYFNKQNPAGIIWANVMKKVNSGLNKTKFKQPAWIQVATICSETGMVANSGCTNTIEEYFLIGTKPGNCTKHSGKKITQTENKNNQQEEENQNVFNNDLTLEPEIETEAPKNNNKKENKTNTNNNVTNTEKNNTNTSTKNNSTNTNITQNTTETTNTNSSTKNNTNSGNVSNSNHTKTNNNVVNNTSNSTNSEIMENEE